MDLVDKEDSSLAVKFAPLLGFVDGMADFGNAGQYCIDGDKMGAGGIGDNARQSGFTGARRAIENQR